jgi:hypothetical protein
VADDETCHHWTDIGLEGRLDYARFRKSSVLPDDSMMNFGRTAGYGCCYRLAGGWM